MKKYFILLLILAGTNAHAYTCDDRMSELVNEIATYTGSPQPSFNLLNGAQVIEGSGTTRMIFLVSHRGLSHVINATIEVTVTQDCKLEELHVINRNGRRS